MILHPQEKGNTYKLFVNGALLNTTNVYDFAWNRAFGIATFLKLEDKFSGSELIIDKWRGKNGIVIITKE